MRCPRSWAPAGPNWKEKRRRPVSARAGLDRAVFRRRGPRHRRRLEGQARDVLSHWPVSNEHGGRLQWFKSDLSKAPPPQIPPSYLPENHWFQKLRDAEAALFLKYESHFERFIAYDSELTVPIPLKIRGGPDEYTLQNLTGHKLLDIAVIVPTPDGFRVGWLDELPTAAPEKKEEAAPPRSLRKRRSTRFSRRASPRRSDDEPPPLPAEGDATVKARVDQQLNRPVVVTVEKAPRRDVLDLITGQVRLRYELDDRTLAKEDINLTRTTSMNATGIAARDALADLLGNLGLSYRVADDGRLYITTAARLSEAARRGLSSKARRSSSPCHLP